MDNGIKIFEGNRIRSLWVENEEEWFFSVIDIVAVLTDSKNPNDYWYRVKKRMTNEEQSELSTICRKLKMRSSDGKKYNTDAANLKGVFRIIQSIPSPKAEPFKLWLAEVAKERIDEVVDPELSIDRALENYLKKGYSKEWINQRLQSIQVRKELTDEWSSHGVKEGIEYAILTDEITKSWSGMTTKEYKNLKGLKKENLRDNMTTLEIVLNMLAEATTTEFTRVENPDGLEENKKIARKGGEVAGKTRKEIENITGKPITTSKNSFDMSRFIEEIIE